jgi:hypothetical protein
VTGNELREWNPNYDYLNGLAPFDEDDIQKNDNEEVKMEKQRRIAFRQDIHEMKDHVFWHNYIVNQSEARKVEFQRSNKGSFSSRSSRRSRDFDNNPGTPTRAPKVAILKKRKYRPSGDNYGGVYQPATLAKTSRGSGEYDGYIIVGQQSRSIKAKQATSANISKRRRPSPEEESPMAEKVSRTNGQSHIIIDTDSDAEASPVIKKPSRRQRKNHIIINGPDPDTDGQSEVVVKATTLNGSQSTLSSSEIVRSV